MSSGSRSSTPSTTKSGEASLSVPVPRIRTKGAAPGAPELLVTCTPATLQALHGRLRRHGGEFFPIQRRYGPGEVAFLLGAVAYHYHFGQGFYVFGQGDVYRRAAIDRHFLRHKADVGKRQGIFTGGIQPVVAIQIRDGTDGSALHQHVDAR